MVLIVTRIWILLSAGLVGAGWILSALRALNPAGYLAFLAVAGLGLAGWWWQSGWRPRPAPGGWRRRFRRFRRPAPLLFLALFLLAALSGMLYAPLPGDASMYRTPRVLHWLQQGHWHWIRTFDPRMNIANCGFEWLSAPLLLFTHTDRLFFLINLGSYALLPGLIFRVFRRLRVRRRVAWWWMWLLPAAFCYTLQAGTLANDAFALVYALAAVELALAAATSRRAADLWLSVLAIALVTGAKQTDLPLVLVWFIAALPALHLLRGRLLGTAAVLAVGALVSGLPMIFFNLQHDGNWVGLPNHPGLDWQEWQHTAGGSVFWNFTGNLFCLPLGTFAPPLFPASRAWEGMMQHFLSTPLGAHFASFERFGLLSSSMNEQNAGLGFMLGGLLVLSGFWIWRSGPLRKVAPAARPGWQIRLLWLVPWGLLALFMAKVTSFESVRQLSPYYPFLLSGWLAWDGMAAVVRQRWWPRLALLSMVVSGLVLVIAPARPLWPADTVLNALTVRFPHSGAVARARSFYPDHHAYGLSRPCFPNSLPSAETVVGYATDSKGLEPALWRPFQRRVERILPGDSREYLAAQGIHYVVLDRGFMERMNCSREQFIQTYHARQVDELVFSGGWNRPSQSLYLFRVNAD